MSGSRDLGDGVQVDYFVKNCSFFQGVLESICRRILSAAGLDINSSKVVVPWKLYLELYCTFEAG